MTVLTENQNNIGSNDYVSTIVLSGIILETFFMSVWMDGWDGMGWDGWMESINKIFQEYFLGDLVSNSEIYQQNFQKTISKKFIFKVYR